MSHGENLWVVSSDRTLISRLLFVDHFEVIPREKLILFEPDSPYHSVLIYDIDGVPKPLAKADLSRLKRSFPLLRIVAMADSVDTGYALQLLKSGAHGFLYKKESDLRIEEAVAEVVKRGVPLSAEVGQALLHSSWQVLDPPSAKVPLKKREVELLQMMSEGFTKKEISQKSGRSIHTVDNHIRRVYEKLGVNNLGEAIGEAFRAGIIT